MKRAVIIIFLGLLLTAVSVYFFRRKSEVIIHPHRGDITEAVYGLGKVKSHEKFDVIIGILSTISRMDIDEGSFAREGQALLWFERGQVVRAPFSGTVTYLRFRKGETALPNTPILRLENLSRRYLELSLEQESALRIMRGQRAKISFENLRGNTLEGSVTALYPRDDEFIAQVESDLLPDNVLPGMTADVSIEVGEIKNGILIPVSAVSEGMVTVRRRGHWKKEKVELGHADGLSVEVLGSALSENDELLLKEGE